VNQVRMRSCCWLWFEKLTSQAAFDTAFAGAGGNYDLRSGAIYAYGSGADTEFAVSDVFVVSGVPDGTPLMFTGSLHLTGSAGVDCNADQFAGCSAAFQVIGSSSRFFSRGVGSGPDCAGSVSFDETLDIPIERLAGEAFTIYIRAAAGQDPHGGGAGMRTQLSFSGQPQGAM
jgi:hypothetical protein